MHKSTASTRYLAVLSPTRSGFSASLPDLPGCVAAGKDYPTTLEAIREALALHLEAMREDGDPIPPPVSTQVDDLEASERIEWVEPATINPVSQAVSELIRSTGKSLRSLAPEVGINYAALSRMQDPFYWGHSLATLRRLAEALGKEVHIEFQPAA